MMCALASLYGCKEGNTPGSTLEEMNFNVTDSLLAPAVSDPQLGASFRPPRGWGRVDQRIVDSARAIAAAQAGSSIDKSETVHYVFADSVSRGFLAVMRLDTFDVGDSSASVKGYVEKLRAADPDLRIETALFRKGDFRVHQVRAVSPSSVTLRMTFDNLEKRAPILAFNYVLPREQYESKAREIESSVGSLQPLSSIP
jgi:hypothetical protein